MRVTIGCGALGLASLLAFTGCRTDPFACDADGQCLDGDDMGACEPNGYCSFDDDACPSGRRYGHLAGGGLAERCVVDDDPTSTSSASTTTSTSISTSTSTTSTSVADSSTTGVESSTTSTTAMTSTTSAAGANGEPCSSAFECNSGHCFANALGGVCSECTQDEDCEFGCTPPSLLKEDSAPAVCNAGALGDGCETSDACTDGLECVEVYSIPGVFNARGCSECGSDVDCDPFGVSLCTPNISLTQTHAHMTCSPAGSLALGEFCDHNSSGDLSCTSGYCASSSVMGLFVLGVCSECSNDDTANEGCSSGDVCSTPEIGLGEPNTPGTCI